MAAYDLTKPLVIDPVLSYSTYLGGSGGNVIGSAIAVDAAGNAYVTGYTASSDFPTTPGAFQRTPSGDYDAFVTKLNPTGTALVYSTYLGGSGYDSGSAIAVDAAGNAYVTGYTASSDFPTTPGAFQRTWPGYVNAFVTKLNPTGAALVYSTYLGGSSLDSGSAIAVDAAGNAYVTGWTWSSDFPTTPGAFQRTPSGTSAAFVTKFVQGRPREQVLGPDAPFAGYSADPVNTATGNYTYTATDLRLPGIGLGLAFTRVYNAQDETTGPLGYGWTHAYHVRLIPGADGTQVVRWGDGRVEPYTPDGQGGFTAPLGVHSQLVVRGDGTATLTTRDQHRYQFSSGGRLTALQDRNGNTVALSYNGSGDLVTLTAPGGRALALAYDASHRITTLTDPLTRTVRYTYDSHGDLTTVQDTAGGLTRFTYDGQRLLLTVTDPLGHVRVSNTYDGANRVVTVQQDALLSPTTYHYDTVTRETTIGDALGGVTVHTHDAYLRLLAERDARGFTARYTYDTAGNRACVVDKRGTAATYTYDAQGNVTAKTERTPDGVPCDPSGPGLVTTATYDAQNNPLSRTDTLGNVTRFEYDTVGNLTATVDALGGRTAFTYNSFGQVLTVTDPLGRVTENVYDLTSGDLLEVHAPLGGITAYTYDAAGRRLTTTDARGNTTTVSYDPNDNVLTITEPLGRVTAYTYDANNNRLTVTDPNGNVTSTTYDAKDRPATITDPLGNVTTTAYDALDRRASIRDPRGNTTGFEYDAIGNVVLTVNPLGQRSIATYDPNGNKLSGTDPLGNTTAFTYDALNRLLTVADPLQDTTTNAYDALGRLTSVTDAEGRVTKYEYDALGRLTTVTDAANQVTRYTYDAIGNRLSMVDARGDITSYTYDERNRLIRVTDPLGRQGQFAYDAVGNQISQTDARGQTTPRTYDALNRLSTAAYPGGPTLTFTYDPVGNRIAMTDGLGNTTFAYDKLNRLLTMTDPFNKTVGYAYDPAGNRTQLQYPDTKVVKYEYDAANLLQSVTDWLGGVATYTYDAAGGLTGLTQPNGTTATYTYDAGRRLTSLNHARSGGPAIASYNYTLDKVGNRRQATVTEPLEPMLAPAAVTYGYDRADQLLAAGPVTYGYDPDGNQLTRTQGGATTTFTFDARSLLTTAAGPGASTSYRYDGLGHRREVTRDGVVTRYVLDLNGPLATILAEMDAGGNITGYYVHGHQLLAQITPAGERRTYHSDPLGSTVALTNASQTITDAYAYDPYGATVSQTGSTPNPFQYVGALGVMADRHGLLSMRARYYDAATGRFLSTDPVAGEPRQPQSLHRYAYALNNPIRYIDIAGLSASERAQLLARAGSSDDIPSHRQLIGDDRNGSTRLSESDRRRLAARDCRTYSIPRYGKYGGPCWTGGEIGGQSFDVDSVDKMDELFKQHDKAYESNDPSDILRADIALVKGLQSLRDDWYSREQYGQYSWFYANTYRLLAIRVFEDKVAYDALRVAAE